jgi:hypothetical protein
MRRASGSVVEHLNRARDGRLRPILGRRPECPPVRPHAPSLVWRGLCALSEYGASQAGFPPGTR